MLKRFLWVSRSLAHWILQPSNGQEVPGQWHTHQDWAGPAVHSCYATSPLMSSIKAFKENPHSEKARRNKLSFLSIQTLKHWHTFSCSNNTMQRKTYNYCKWPIKSTKVSKIRKSDLYKNKLIRWIVLNSGRELYFMIGYKL
jgi:hypothetical protein